MGDLLNWSHPVIEAMTTKENVIWRYLDTTSETMLENFDKNNIDNIVRW